jgi:hypothetical protein
MPPKLEIPQDAIGKLRNDLLKGNADRRDILELSLSARNDKLNVRDFTAFLRMADRIYASFYLDGPRAYARRYGAQLKIDSLHASLLDIKFLEELNNIVKSNPLITIWIVGNALQKSSVIFKNFTEGLLNLKRLSEVASPEVPKLTGGVDADAKLPVEPATREISERDLAGTSDDELIRIARFLGEALKNENLNQAGRFARDEMVELRLRIKKG